MKKEKNFTSLNFKMVFIVIFLFVSSIALYFSAHAAVNFVIEKFYLSDAAIDNRNDSLARSLNEYVKKNNLSTSDFSRINEWCKRQNYIYLTFYKNKKVVFETGWWDDTSLTEGMTDFYQGTEQDETTTDETKSSGNETTDETLYPIYFSDKTLNASIMEFSEEKYYTIGDYSILMGCFVLFVLAMFFYNRHITKSIISLSHKVREVEQGNLQLEITEKGHDELANLAADVNEMRKSILTRLQENEEVWNANSNLITSISHDIRTPLTVLVGYLDIINGKQYQSDEQLKEYTQICVDKAKQLKDLSDEMFRYFLVFGKPELEFHIEEYDAITVLAQMIGEHMVYLRDNGFSIQYVMPEESCGIKIDVMYMKRVFDNLFSNIEKHADIHQDVTVNVVIEGGKLHIVLVNGIPDVPNKVESTKIGLQTCQKIIVQMQGIFDCHEENNQFIAQIDLPVKDISNNTAG